VDGGGGPAGLWRFEDGGPQRRQSVAAALGIDPREELRVTTRLAPVVTMVVAGATGARYLLRHGAGPSATCTVEAIDPVTLEPLATSGELAGGPVWPGGIGVHDNGSIYVVFGNHAHRLDPQLRLLASRELPRQRPYNSFVPLPDGLLVTKDFGGSTPAHTLPRDQRVPCELVVLDPDLRIVDTLELPEPSVARLSADGDTVYAVGDPSLLRARWDGARLRLDPDFRPRYLVHAGQTYGWDCVIALGAAWFLDDGDGSERFNGSLRGNGLSSAPLHLVRVDLASGEVHMAEVCGAPGGLVANPPVVDERRGIAVAYDSGNGVLRAFGTTDLEPLWRREQDHGSHLLLYEESGELVTGDHEDVVVIDVATGDELARARTGWGIQSVLFPSPGSTRDFYVCSLMGVSRVEVVPPPAG